MENHNVELLDAAREGNLGAAQAALDAGADVNATNNGRETPLHLASMYGHIEVVLALLDRNDINVNPIDNIGRAPLHWASENGHISVVVELIHKIGINLALRDNAGHTPQELAFDAIVDAAFPEQNGGRRSGKGKSRRRSRRHRTRRQRRTHK